MLSAVIVYEAAIVMNFRSGPAGVAGVPDFLASSRAESSRSPFDDCVSHALAKSLDAPLLFKGRDFAATDIRAAI